MKILQLLQLVLGEPGPKSPRAAGERSLSFPRVRAASQLPVHITYLRVNPYNSLSVRFATEYSRGKPPAWCPCCPLGLCLCSYLHVVVEFWWLCRWPGDPLWVARMSPTRWTMPSRVWLGLWCLQGKGEEVRSGEYPGHQGTPRSTSSGVGTGICCLPLALWI